jgi:ribosomal protein S13
MKNNKLHKLSNESLKHVYFLLSNLYENLTDKESYEVWEQIECTLISIEAEASNRDNIKREKKINQYQIPFPKGK